MQWVPPLGCSVCGDWQRLRHDLGNRISVVDCVGDGEEGQRGFSLEEDCRVRYDTKSIVL